MEGDVEGVAAAPPTLTRQLAFELLEVDKPPKVALFLGLVMLACD